MLCLFTAACLALAPQVPEPPSQPQMRFVDFSHDLDNPNVSVLIGRLGKLKEGRRERIEQGGRLGGGSAVTAISGTQYYKVPTRARIEAPEVLAGAPLKGRPELAFDVQLARLPDGNEHRQSMTANAAPLHEGLLALWVVEMPSKGRRLALRHVIPFHSKADVGDDPERAFADNMADFSAVNQRMLALRAALAATADVRAKDRDAALERLRAVAREGLELKNPKNDVLIGPHVAPLTRRLEERIAELEKEAGDG